MGNNKMYTASNICISPTHTRCRLCASSSRSRRAGWGWVFTEKKNFMTGHVCLRVCLPVCLPACLLACLPAFLPAPLSACMRVCGHARVSVVHPAHGAGVTVLDLAYLLPSSELREKLPKGRIWILCHDERKM